MYSTLRQIIILLIIINFCISFRLLSNVKSSKSNGSLFLPIYNKQIFAYNSIHSRLYMASKSTDSSKPKKSLLLIRKRTKPSIRDKAIKETTSSDSINIDEDELKRLWTATGKSLSSFNIRQAILLSISNDDDSYDDDEDGFIDLTTHTSSSTSKSTAPLSSIISTLSKNNNNKASSPTTSSSLPTTTTSSPTPRSTSTTTPSTRSVGIDLGTTYSAISIMEAGRPKIIPINGDRIIPSIVGYLPNNTILVGELARRQMVVNPHNTFASVKRVIGRTINEILTNGDKLSTLKIDNKNVNKHTICTLKCPILNRPLLPEEVSAEVLKQLLSAASTYIGTNTPITNAVITVPAYYMPSQCQATERAGKLAGLNKIKLLREPEAAALAYGLARKSPQVVLVFDLGGGTFDVSILEVGGGLVEVIATSGDAHLVSIRWYLVYTPMCTCMCMYILVYMCIVYPVCVC